MLLVVIHGVDSSIKKGFCKVQLKVKKRRLKINNCFNNDTEKNEK